MQKRYCVLAVSGTGKDLRYAQTTHMEYSKTYCLLKRPLAGLNCARVPGHLYRPGVDFSCSWADRVFDNVNLTKSMIRGPLITCLHADNLSFYRK